MKQPKIKFNGKFYDVSCMFFKKGELSEIRFFDGYFCVTIKKGNYSTPTLHKEYDSVFLYKDLESMLMEV